MDDACVLLMRQIDCLVSPLHVCRSSFHEGSYFCLDSVTTTKEGVTALPNPGSHEVLRVLLSGIIAIHPTTAPRTEAPGLGWQPGARTGPDRT